MSDKGLEPSNPVIMSKQTIGPTLIQIVFLRNPNLISLQIEPSIFNRLRTGCVPALADSKLLPKRKEVEENYLIPASQAFNSEGEREALPALRSILTYKIEAIGKC